jgi:hypothetical protein
MDDYDKNAARHAANLPSNNVNSESGGRRYHNNGQISEKSFGDVFSRGDRYSNIDGMIFRNGTYIGSKDDLRDR